MAPRSSSAREQFLEIMALLRGLGDQIHLVRLREPPGIQVHDLLNRPFKHEELTKTGRYETECARPHTGRCGYELAGLPFNTRTSLRRRFGSTWC